MLIEYKKALYYLKYQYIFTVLLTICAMSTIDMLLLTTVYNHVTCSISFCLSILPHRFTQIIPNLYTNTTAIGTDLSMFL